MFAAEAILRNRDKREMLVEARMSDQEYVEDMWRKVDLALDSIENEIKLTKLCVKNERVNAAVAKMQDAYLAFYDALYTAGLAATDEAEKAVERARDGGEE